MMMWFDSRKQVCYIFSFHIFQADVFFVRDGGDLELVGSLFSAVSSPFSEIKIPIFYTTVVWELQHPEPL